MADDEDIAALVIDNGSGMCKGTSFACEFRVWRKIRNVWRFGWSSWSIGE